MISRARALIREGAPVVAFSGAGLSAESGIPTFRDADTGGLWAMHDATRLASPEGFAADPDLVLAWYADRRRAMSRAEPNAAHRTLAAAAGLVNVTQNVDDLLERAGARDVIHLHGEIGVDRCHARCGYREQIDPLDPPGRRACPRCGAPLRPDVVWFGEALPEDAWERATDACLECGVLLVVGTSAEVYPAAGLINVAVSAGASIVVVNTNPSAASDLADVELIGPAGTILPQIL